TKLRPMQEKFVNRMADFLKKNPETSLSISSLPYDEKEKENILLFEAKKKYFLQAGDSNNKILNEEDSVFVDKMSVKDSLFIHYLDKTPGAAGMFTMQEKCCAIITIGMVDRRFNQLKKERKDAFMSYFEGASTRVK